MKFLEFHYPPPQEIQLPFKSPMHTLIFVDACNRFRYPVIISLSYKAKNKIPFAYLSIRKYVRFTIFCEYCLQT